MADNNKKSLLESVQCAELEWKHNTPFSQRYDDIYFSRENGIEETRFVFLKHNNLPEAWQGHEIFTILETGFGTGLNFYCVLEEWFKTAVDNAVLNFISVEKYPLSLADFQQLATVWPQYRRYVDEIVAQYPLLISGFHSIKLFEGRVKLLLLFGDASEQLSQLNCQADACFLDGFAPSRNQSMWTPELFTHLSRLLKPGATISTFTAVGDVRRGLQQAGFAMTKVDAFGSKRHMLAGVLQQAKISKTNPWFQYSFSASNTNSNRSVVIGAGIIGLTTAIALQESGQQVMLIESVAGVASGASGNPAGVVMPRIDKEPNIDAIFYWQAFETALRQYRLFAGLGIETGFEACGVLQLLEDMQQTSWPAGIYEYLERDEASALYGRELTKSAIWIGRAGFIRPEKFCRSLFEHYQSTIDFVFNTEVKELEQTENGWHLITSRGQFDADNIVICNAQFANRFEQTRYMPLQSVRGQISMIDEAYLSQANSVICEQGYVIQDGNQLLLGASFVRDDEDRALRSEEQYDNIQKANRCFTENSQISVRPDYPLAGRVSVRAVTQDRMPVVGAVPDVDFFHKHYADLAYGRAAEKYPAARYLPGLYINTGHGSRGLTSGVLSAEIVSSLVCQHGLPVSQDILERLHAARGLIRQYRRKSSKQ